MDELRQLIDKTPEDGVRVRGFFRVQITEPDDEFAVAGDSGWVENQITNAGFNNLSLLLGTSLTGSQISHLALGTGGAPNATATSLAGEVASRAAATAASNGSTALQLTATFASSDSFLAGTSNISNVGCFQSVSAGSLFAGNTYASSSCATNQNVNVTYTWTFS